MPRRSPAAPSPPQRLSLPRIIRPALLLAAALLPGTVQAQASLPAPVTIFIVRHAEKVSITGDPSLNKAGRQRAEALARVLGDARVSQVYITEYKRTMETAKPLSEDTKLAITRMGARQVDSLVASLRLLAPGTRALVVSHSNIVPLIVERLTGERIAEITEWDYDRLYLVTLQGEGLGSLMYLHYGAPNPRGDMMRE